MLKRLLLVASLLVPLTVPTLALAQDGAPAAAAAQKPQTKSKTASKGHKAKGTRQRQGRKGSRTSQRSGARRPAKSAKVAG